YDSLLLLQHRGQDASGISTSHDQFFSMYKAHGLVRDVFRTRNMRSLPGNAGLGQVRYPTAGFSASVAEAKPFYENAPFCITFVHYVKLFISREWGSEPFDFDRRPLNADCNSEILLNVVAHSDHHASDGRCLDDVAVVPAVVGVRARCRGACAVFAQIADFGM